MVTENDGEGRLEAFWAPEDESVRRCLDDVGVHYGTELSSLSRDYLRIWERFLAPLRDQAFDLLDIGAGAGASLRTWREWFPFARLIGLEARRLVLDPPIAGCSIVHGSQTDLAVLHHVLRDKRFRLIVDDGSRRADDQVSTFLTVFPWLDAASVYICASLPDGALTWVDESAQRAGAVWFSDLGRALTASGDRPPGDPATLNLILRKATGIFLMRGCAIVTS